jgi:hypothetical protein
MDRQCSSCGGFCKKSGCERENVKSPPQLQPMTLEKLREHWEGAKVLDMTDAEISFSDYVLIVKDVEALYGIKEKT